MPELLILDIPIQNMPKLPEEYTLHVLDPSTPTVERTAALQKAEVIIGEPTPEELHQARKLRWVQLTWAGFDRYTKKSFPEHVLLTTASGAFGSTIAEHALAMLLALCRRLPAYIRENNIEDLGSEKQLAGGNAVIFGCGDIGTQIAARMKALGVSTVGVCRNVKQPRPYFDALTTLACVPALLPEADFVLCALPHTTQTAGFLNAERLALLKKDAILINVGRGSLIDTAALIECLQKGSLFGVGLDVVLPDPLPQEHPLRFHPRVLLTPHVAGVGFRHLRQTEDAIWKICLENLRRYLDGKPMKNKVQPE